MRALAPVSVLFISLAFLAPRVARAQDAAEVTCKDGTKSHAGKGACSGHGGVDKSGGSTSSKSASGTAAAVDPDAAVLLLVDFELDSLLVAGALADEALLSTPPCPLQAPLPA